MIRGVVLSRSMPWRRWLSKVVVVGVVLLLRGLGSEFKGTWLQLLLLRLGAKVAHRLSGEAPDVPVAARRCALARAPLDTFSLSLLPLELELSVA